MTEMNRAGNSEKFNFKGIPSFLQVCEKRSVEKSVECLHSDGSVIYIHQKLRC